MSTHQHTVLTRKYTFEKQDKGRAQCGPASLESVAEVYPIVSVSIMLATQIYTECESWMQI